MCQRTDKALPRPQAGLSLAWFCQIFWRLKRGWVLELFHQIIAPGAFHFKLSNSAKQERFNKIMREVDIFAGLFKFVCHHAS